MIVFVHVKPETTIVSLDGSERSANVIIFEQLCPDIPGLFWEYKESLQLELVISEEDITVTRAVLEADAVNPEYDSFEIRITAFFPVQAALPNFVERSAVLRVLGDIFNSWFLRHGLDMPKSLSIEGFWGFARGAGTFEEKRTTW